MLAQDISMKRMGARSRFARWRSVQADWRIGLFCYLTLAPVLALFLYVRLIPIAWSVIISFYRWDLIRPLKPFIGLANYENLLCDPTFLLALHNTAIYSSSAAVVSILLA